MVNIDIVYEGQLHCRLTHGPSGNVISTDAPKDNNGKGEAFSPTDLVAAALGSCMLTVMGIAGAKHNLKLDGATVKVVKEMVTAPERRIGTLTVAIAMPKGIPAERRSMLEHAAHACPVHKSLHPDVKIALSITYPD